MYNVLIVDDDLTASMLFAKRLRFTLSCSVSYATDGIEGFQKARDEQPDLIILDVRMPNLTGIETLEKLRVTAETEHIPVVMYSANDDPGEREHSFQLGAQGFCLKHDDLRKTLETVKSVLTSKPARDIT